MRIAFVTFEYPPHIIGGAGTYAQRITAELANLGQEVVIFTPQVTDADKLSSPGVAIQEVPVEPNRPLGALQFWLGLPSVLRQAEERTKFDIVHINGTSYWFLSRLSDAPLVVTIHHLAKDTATDRQRSISGLLSQLDKESGPLLPLIEKRAVRQSTRVVTVSNYTRERLIQLYAVDPNKVGVVHNGSSHDANASVDLLGADALLRPSGGRKTILFVGRLNDPRKGLDILMMAMPSVLRRVDAALVVAGQGDLSRMKKISDGMGLGGRVLFTGFVSDPVLLGLYRSCDVYVCPSRLEGFGLTVLDAQLFGRKVVATRVGAIPEIASRDTVLVDPDDPDGLASAIVTTLTAPDQTNTPAKAEAARDLWKEAAMRMIGEYEISMRGR